jgi:acyl carrier protein
MNTVEKIQAIFKEKFHFEVQEEYFTQNISLGPTGIGFNTIELFYLIYFIESEFQIQFTRDNFVSGAIRTLSGLCRTINELCKETVPEVALNS